MQVEKLKSLLSNTMVRQHQSKASDVYILELKNKTF